MQQHIQACFDYIVVRSVSGKQIKASDASSHSQYIASKVFPTGGILRHSICLSCTLKSPGHPVHRDSSIPAYIPLSSGPKAIPLSAMTKEIPYVYLDRKNLLISASGCQHHPKSWNDYSKATKGDVAQ